MNANIATCQETDMSVGNSTANMTEIGEKYCQHHKILCYYYYVYFYT